MFSNRNQSVPAVFQEIMKNDNERASILAYGPRITVMDWRRLVHLRKRKVNDLIPSAEKALSWNTDKGKAK